MGFDLAVTPQGRPLDRPLDETVASGRVHSTANAGLHALRRGWDQLPPDAEALDPHHRDDLQPIAEATRVLGPARKLEAGDTVRAEHEVARLTWRAYHDCVIVFRVQASCTHDDGQWVPAGPWTLVDAAVHRPTQPPRRTQGTVPAGELTEAAGTGDVAAASQLPGDLCTGASLARTLPIPVQQTMAAAVRHPTLWVGNLIETGFARGMVQAHRLDLLRMDQSAIAVVRAERAVAPGAHPDRLPGHQFAHLPWTVTQVVYPLDGPGPAVQAVAL